MPQTNGSELGTTYDCKTPGCTGTARSRVGRYSYCDACQARRGSSTATPPLSSTGLVAALDGLKKMARDADRAEARAKQLTVKALAAKAQADRLRAEFARKVAEIGTPA